jgi:carbon storage regulator CsrA
MLVLSRRAQEKIYFPALNITVQVVGVKRGRVRLGVEAPPEVAVLREEVQGLETDGQRPETGPAERADGTGPRPVGYFLRIARAGLGLARRRLQPGEAQAAGALLDKIREVLRELW